MLLALINSFSVLTILLTASTLSSSGQLNRKDTLNRTAKVSGGGSLLEGNAARLLLAGRLELAYANASWGMSARIDYQYGTTKRSKTENDFVSYHFVYLRPLATIYPFFMIISETNYRRRIGFRYQFGPGLSYTLPGSSIDLLRVSLTGTFEHTGFKATRFEHIRDSTENTIKVWRLTARVFGKGRLAAKQLSASYEFWWQQSLSDFQNYRFYNEEVVEIPVNNMLNFRTGFRFTWENVRVKGLKAYDLFWTFGFAISGF